MISRRGARAPNRLNGVVYDAFTKVLLHFNGVDGSTTFIDESGKVWTPSGNAQIDTAQSVFGGASGLFDGTGDYLTTPDHDDFFFDGDFTIDGWFLFHGLPAISDWATFLSLYTDGSNFMNFGLFNSAGTYYLRLQVYTGGAQVISGSKAFTPTLDTTWYHIALTRSGNDYRIFANGNQVGTTTTDADPLLNYTGVTRIGRRAEDVSCFNGWMDEFRVSKGIARWIANFTPPVAEYSLTS